MNFMSELKICKHFYDTGREGPVMVDIHPTLACQNACYFCISANTHIAGMKHENFSRGKTIDWTDLRRVIDELKCMGTSSVQLTGGGEPLLYPHFDKLLRELKPLRVGLITNGILLGEYAREVADSCEWVRVSLDAAGAEMYRQIKSADNYHMAVDGIDKLCEARGEAEKPRIGVGYVLTSESIPGIVHAAYEMAKRDIDYIQFRDVVERGRTFNDEMRQKIRTLVGQARHVTTGLDIMYTSHHDETVPEGMDPDFIPVCDATDYVAVIGADSQVYGCCHLEYQDFASYGSIKERGFKEIWENRPTVNISEALCWNCRFRKTNKVLRGLKAIQDGDFV